jgi:type I restriction enzyme S subunit
MKSYPSYKSSEFGLISRIPTHWDENTIKRGFEITLGKMLQSDSKQDTDFLAPYLRSANVQSGKVDVSDVQEMWFSPSEAIQLALEPGDLVVCEGGDAGRAAFWNGEIEICYFQNAVNRVRSCGGNSPKYLMYWMSVIKDGGYLDIICNKATIAHLTKEKLSNLPMLYPPHDEQTAIGAYLDAETERIDELVSQKHELLAHLGCLRESAIQECTAGVNVKGERRNTGDPFMPDLPSHWRYVRIGRVAKVGNGSTPYRQNEDYWLGGTFPWLNSSVVNNDEVIEGSEFITDVALLECHLPRLQSGTVVMAMIGQGATRGKVAVLRIEATLSQNIAYIAAEEDLLNCNYLFWYLTGAYRQIRYQSDGRGGNQSALNCDQVSRLMIPLPPLNVQAQIANELKQVCLTIDDLIKHVNSEIKLLHELRAATITDAVLGRIDIRKAKNN